MNFKKPIETEEYRKCSDYVIKHIEQIIDVWQFCQLLDKKYLAYSKRNFDEWLILANRNKWIKIDDLF